MQRRFAYLLLLAGWGDEIHLGARSFMKGSFAVVCSLAGCGGENALGADAANLLESSPCSSHPHAVLCRLSADAQVPTGAERAEAEAVLELNAVARDVTSTTHAACLGLLGELGIADPAPTGGELAQTKSRCDAVATFLASQVGLRVRIDAPSCMPEVPLSCGRGPATSTACQEGVVDVAGGAAAVQAALKARLPQLALATARLDEIVDYTGQVAANIDAVGDLPDDCRRRAIDLIGDAVQKLGTIASVAAEIARVVQADGAAGGGS